MDQLSHWAIIRPFGASLNHPAREHDGVPALSRGLSSSTLPPLVSYSLKEFRNRPRPPPDPVVSIVRTLNTFIASPRSPQCRPRARRYEHVGARTAMEIAGPIDPPRGGSIPRVVLAGRGNPKVSPKVNRRELLAGGSVLAQSRP